VAEHLRALVFQDGLTEGDQLPSQADIADELGVSRLIVREATRILEAQGLVHAEQGRRLTVARPNGRHLGDLFDLFVRSDQRALFELLEVRAALELHSVKLAAENATATDVSRMRSAIDLLGAASSSRRNLEAQADNDGAFHEAVAAATRNRVMLMLIEALASPLRELRVQSLKGTWDRAGSLESVIEGHEAIAQGIADRDPDAAGKAMAEHLGYTLVDLRGGPPKT
jgi:GntR family transcriptional repressor for pyruvate dehydrogenase complex